MASVTHKGQILPLENQMIPISKDTVFHASYDYSLKGMNQGEIVNPLGPPYERVFNKSIVNAGYVFTSTPSAVTVEAWVKIPVLPGASEYPTIIDFGAPGNSFYAELAAGSDKIIFGGYMGTGGGNFSGLSQETRVTIPIGSWFHMAYSVTPTEMKIYINGVLQTTTVRAFNLVKFQEDVRIGGGRNYLNGSLYDIRVWSYERKADEIMRDMQTDLIGSENGLVANWKLRDKEGPIAFDTAGTSDGVYNGSPTQLLAGNVYANLTKEGKFGSAVLVEPDTTNLMPNGDFRNGIDGWNISYTENSEVSFTYAVKQENGKPYLNLRWARLSGTGNIWPTLKSSVHGYATAGKLYTLSCWVRINEQNRATFQIRHSSKDNDYWTTNRQIWSSGGREKGVWHRVVLRRVFDATYTDGTGTAYNLDAKFEIYSDSHSQTGDVTDFDIREIQIEERDTATSYVEGSRPLGRLWYPKELINPNAFTIGMWFNIPWMHTADTKNTGIQGNWYNPIIELATTTNSTESLSLVAGPQPDAWGRKLNLISHGRIANFAVQDDTWYHVIIRFDGTTYKVFMDGVEVISVAGNKITPAATAVLMVGGGYRGKPHIKIDELRIEKRAISDDEVAAWAASGLHYNYLDYTTKAD